MPDNLTFLVRQMVQRDLRSALNLSLTEGWNQTEKDWNLLLDNPLNVCFVAVSGQKVIGTATAMNYSNLLGWIGMVLVDREFRRQGIGRMLVASIIEKLNGFKSIKLDATPAGQSVYKKLGFIEERVLYRMNISSFKHSDKKSIKLIPEYIKSKDIDEIIKFDKTIFGVDRTYLLKTIMRNNPDRAFLIKQNGIISGYVMGRIGAKSNYIGPVFAHTTDDAQALILKSLYSMNRSPVTLDVQEDKNNLIKWLESIGFIRQRQFVRMFLENNPYPGEVENQYLIIGPEFG